MPDLMRSDEIKLTNMALPFIEPGSHANHQMIHRDWGFHSQALLGGQFQQVLFRAIEPTGYILGDNYC